MNHSVRNDAGPEIPVGLGKSGGHYGVHYGRWEVRESVCDPHDHLMIVIDGFDQMDRCMIGTGYGMERKRIFESHNGFNRSELTKMSLWFRQQTVLRIFLLYID